MVQRAGVSKGLLTLLDQVDALAPGRNRRNDGTVGDARHRAKKSDHNPDASGRIRALDITKDLAHGVDVQKIADQIAASRDPRLLYFIHNNQMLRSYDKPGIPAWTWHHEEKGHEEHLHISTVASDKIADDTTPWKISLGASPMPQPATSFEQRAVAMMPRLMKDLALYDFQSAGMVGNFGQESRMGELFHQERGTAIGLAQWDGDRKQQFLDFAASLGKAPEDPEVQYKFLIKELNSTENTSLRLLKQTQTLDEATESFCTHFERPGKPMMEKRLEYAERALDAYKAVTEPQPQEPVEPWRPGPDPWIEPPPTQGPSFPPFFPPSSQGGLGGLFNTITDGMEILDLLKRIPKDLSPQQALGAVKAGLRVAVFGPQPEPLQLEPPRSQPMSTFENRVTAQKVDVAVQSAAKSKINWTQAIAGVLQVINLGTALAGGLDPKYGVAIAGGLGILGNAVTWVQRTFFTTTVTPSSITPQMNMRG